MKIEQNEDAHPTEHDGFYLTVSGDELVFLGIAVAAAMDFKGTTSAEPHQMLMDISAAISGSMIKKQGG